MSLEIIKDSTNKKTKKNKETEKNKEERNDYNLPKAIGLY